MKTPASTSAGRVEFQFARPRAVRRSQSRGDAPAQALDPAPGKAPDVPKAARLLVVGYFFERLVSEGKVKDYAEIARLMGLTRARITQIVDRILLPGDQQSELLLMPRKGCNAGARRCEHHLQRTP